MGLEELLTGRIREFPGLSGRLQRVSARRAFSRKAEEGELFVSKESAALLLVGLMPERFLDRPGLKTFLRKELMRADDMLDPVFAYDRRRTIGGENPVKDELIRERFRLLWDLWTRARMKRRGWLSLEEAKPLHPPAALNGFSEVVAGREHWTQEELLALARTAPDKSSGGMDRRTFLRRAPQKLTAGVRGLFSDPADSETGRRPVAVLDVSRCLAWSGVDCQLCHLRCPLREKAILLDSSRPVIVASACDGCGICVKACEAVNQPATIGII
jgi:Pyruvate/2-oxoacid:ferredoxin oxidoreductase delta subunit